jgi:hypothetical protein
MQRFAGKNEFGAAPITGGFLIADGYHMIGA